MQSIQIFNSTLDEIIGITTSQSVTYIHNALAAVDRSKILMIIPNNPKFIISDMKYEQDRYIPNGRISALSSIKHQIIIKQST